MTQKQKYVLFREQRLIWKNIDAAPLTEEDGEEDEEKKADIAAISQEVARRVGASVQLPEAMPLFEQLHYLLANTPATLVMSMLREEGLTEEVRTKLVPFSMGGMELYLQEKLPGSPPIADLLNDDEKLIFAFLHAKDVFTAEHCVDVFVAAQRALALSDIGGRIDEEQKKILLKASLLHDCGKCDLPSIVLLNPISRPVMGLLHRAQSGGQEAPKDPRSIPLQALLDGSQKIFDVAYRKFVALRTEAQFASISDETLAHLQGELEKNRATQPPDLIKEAAATALLEAARALKENPYAETVFGYLKRQKDDLMDADRILKRYAISPKQTFKDGIDTHEAASLRLIAEGESRELNGARVANTVAQHHSYPITAAVREQEVPLTRDNPPPPGDAILRDLIRLCDIKAALAQQRSYFEGQKPKPPEVIAKILREEAGRGFVDPAVTEVFVRGVVKVQ